MIGSTLKDEFHIERELGRGGMGVVYEGIQLSLGRRVAIKVLQAWQDEPVAYERFAREARAASRLSHAHIVQVIDYGVTAGAPFLVMELCGGISLAALLKKTGPLPPTRALRLIGQLAAALTVAHQSGVIHRDIKPDNLLVLAAGDGEQLKVLDFGIASLCEGEERRLTQSGAILGTPTYMAPEQAKGESARVDGRADLYSMGVVLYEMLSGRPPFQGSMIQLLLAHTTQPPPPLSAEIPLALRALVLRLLAKEPAARYPDAAAVSHELAYVAANLHPPAPPARRSRAPLLAAVALLVLGGLGLWGWRSTAAPPSGLVLAPSLTSFEGHEETPPSPDLAAPLPTARPTVSESGGGRAPRPPVGKPVGKPDKPRARRPDIYETLQRLRDAHAVGHYATVVGLFPQVRPLVGGRSWSSKDHGGRLGLRAA